MTFYSSGFDTIVGAHENIREALAVAQRIASSDSPVLISGEFGTGKKLFARHIHANSLERDRQFLSVFSYDIRRSDIEMLMREGNYGTIYFDNIVRLGVQEQLLLVEFLRERRAAIPSDSVSFPRVIFGALERHESMRNSKSLRDEFYYQIGTLNIHLAPLSERTGDVPLLGEYFVGEFATQFGKPVPSLSSDATEALSNYHWPGNVQELRGILERAVLLSESTVIGTDYFPIDLSRGRVDVSAILQDQPSLDDLERRYIVETYRQCGADKQLTCERLGISNTTLWRKLKSYEIESSVAEPSGVTQGRAETVNRPS